MKKIKKNQAIKIYTGAYILRDITRVNTVCMEEDCYSDGKKVRITKKFKTGNNIRIKGEDVKKNKEFFIWKKIRSMDLAQLIFHRCKKIKVFKKFVLVFFHLETSYVNFKKNLNIKYMMQIN